MSIASEITRITDNVADAYTAANAKGATMPVTQNSDNLASTVATIPTGITPTGTINITANDTYDVTNYANASVAVPTAAPDYYISKSFDNGTLGGANEPINLHGVNDVSTYGLSGALRKANLTGQTAFTNTNLLTSITQQCAFKECCADASFASTGLSSVTSITGKETCSHMCETCRCVSTGLTSLQTIGGDTTALSQYTCEYMFAFNNTLTSTDLGNLRAINPQLNEAQNVGTCGYMFKQNTALNSTGLVSLESINGKYACNQMFYGCTALTNIGLNNLREIRDGYVLCDMFYKCTGLITAELPSLETADAEHGFDGTFYECSNLTTFTFTKLKSIKAEKVFSKTFSSCGQLRNLYFPKLRPDSFGNITTQFDSMLSSCNNVTIHFPPQIQSVIGSWASVLACFDATSSTVVFDAGISVTVSIPSGYTVYANGADITNESTTYMYEGDNEIVSVSSDGKIGKYIFTATSGTTSFTFDPTQITYNEFTITANESGATYTASAKTDWITVAPTVDSNNKVYCSAGFDLTVSGTLSGYYANPVTQTTTTSGTITLTFGVLTTVVYNPSDLLSAITGDTSLASEDSQNNLFLYHPTSTTSWAGSVQLQLTPPTGTTTIIISTNAYVSSEENYDFGYLALGTARPFPTPTYDRVKSGVIANGIYLFRQSGQNNTMTPVSYICEDPTQNVLTIGYAQDNTLKGTNTLYIEPISIGYVVA